jgi:hypothetical protein
MGAKPLPEVLAYEAPEIVLRFAREKNLSRQESENLFNECKRWLWACARCEEDSAEGLAAPAQLLISPELETIDEMWHCFLMFTREYFGFCEKYLGRIIHHVPLTSTQIEQFDAIRATDPERALRLRREEVRPQLGYLYDLLGPEVLSRWYRRA